MVPAGSFRGKSAVACEDPFAFGQAEAKVGDRLVELPALRFHRGEAFAGARAGAGELCCPVIVKVVQVEKLPDLGEREAETLAAEDELQPPAAAAGEEAFLPPANRGEQRLCLVETQGAGRDAELGAHLADRPQVLGHEISPVSRRMPERWPAVAMQSREKLTFTSTTSVVREICCKFLLARSEGALIQGELDTGQGERVAVSEMQTFDSLRVLTFLRRSALAGTVLVVVLFGLLAWDHLVSRTEMQATRYAELMAEHVQRLVQTQDVVLTAAEEAFSRLADGPDDAAARLFLRRLTHRIEGSVGIAFVRQDGTFAVTSFAPGDANQPQKRQYLQATPPGGIFVDRLRVRPDNVDALVVTRRPEGEAGEQGVWLSAVEIGVVGGFLQAIASGSGEVGTLIRADGAMLVRSIPTEEEIILPPDAPVMQAIMKGGGTFRTVAVADGEERIYAARRVPGTDLFATFGIPMRAVVRDWMLATGAALVVFGALGGAAYMLARSAARRMRAEAAQIANAFDRRLLEEAEKTAAIHATMLRELNHRVKNSLQMIQALIRLQRGKPGGPDLDEVTARVQAIAVIHDLLYQTSGTFDVDFAEMLRRIGASEAIAPPEGRVEVAVEAEPLELDVAIATPLALCAVELLTNATKHAFDEAGGRVTVSLRSRGDGRAVLAIADNGRGLPQEEGRRSGLRVVEALVRQVDGELRVNGDRGARFEIDFPAIPSEERLSAAIAAS